MFKAVVGRGKLLLERFQLKPWKEGKMHEKRGVESVSGLLPGPGM